jgi:lipoprotein-anchoring transpeptidase ErfK/SrfK
MIMGMGRGRHRVRRISRRVLVLLVVLGVLVLGVAGTAFGALRYDRNRLVLILPGVRIDGIDVGNMDRAGAVAAVAAVVDRSLEQQLTLAAGNKIWTETLADLGLAADIDAAVDKAMELSAANGLVSRLYHRITGTPVTDISVTVGYTLSMDAIDAFVHRAATEIAVPARNASFDLVDGKLVKVHARAGTSLSSGPSTEQIKQAVVQRALALALPVSLVRPKVPDSSLGKTIVVNVSQNMLYLYDGLQIIRRYPVATAKQGFVTPDGAWEVVDKVENPTWHNPAPTGWGAGEPLVIPPGPGNPLGTRALYLSAPGIRIHGTPSDSSIGTYASHGCIRMHIPDSEALYPLVPIGTPVFIIGAPPWGVTTNPGAAG